MLNRSEGYLTRPKDITFHREAHGHQAEREIYGIEPIAMTYSEMMEFPEFASITREQHERHFLKHWPTSRPHTVYARLTLEQKQFIESIDPEWVAKEKGKQALPSMM
jgi:hypothetical protein